MPASNVVKDDSSSLSSTMQRSQEVADGGHVVATYSTVRPSCLAAWRILVRHFFWNPGVADGQNLVHNHNFLRCPDGSATLKASLDVHAVE